MLNTTRKRWVAAGIVVVVLVLAAGVIDQCGDGSCGSNGPAERGGPDPGGDPHAAVPVPPGKDKLFGWSGDAYHYNTGIKAATEAAAAAGTGANAHRFPLSWWLVEPEQPGKILPSYVESFDEMYREVTEVHGMRPLILLFIAPPWARPASGKGCAGYAGCFYPPGRLSDWSRFLKWAVNRYPDADFEIWNEPNLKSFWAPEPDPAAWAKLLVESYRTIKSLNPDAKVIAGGINGNLCDDCGLGMSAATFIRRAYAAVPDLGDSMDALSFHPYPEQFKGAVQGLGRNSNYALQWARFNRALRDVGDADQRIWVTETGVTTTGPGGLSGAEQATELQRLYAKTLTMPRVDAVFLYTLVYGPPGIPGSDPLPGYGVMTNDDGKLNPRAAYCAFNRRADVPRAAGC